MSRLDNLPHVQTFSTPRVDNPDDNFNGYSELVSEATAERSITLPDANGAVVLDSNTQTLINKTLTAPILTDPILSNPQIPATFPLDGATILASGANATTKTATFPNATGNVVIDSATQTLTNKTVQAANGTVSAPSVSFTSDTDTGLYRIGANNLGITTNGTKRVDISDSLFSLSVPLSNSSQPFMNLRNNTNILLPHNTIASINGSVFTVNASQGNITSTAGNGGLPPQITIQEAGTYLIILRPSMEANLTSNQTFNYYSYITKNGVAISTDGVSSYITTPATSAISPTNFTVTTCAVNDVIGIDFFVYCVGSYNAETQTPGVNLLKTTDYFTSFIVVKLF